MLHNAGTLHAMLGKVVEHLAPEANISINIHPKTDEERKAVTEALSEAGYSSHETTTKNGTWRQFHMPGRVDHYCHITVF